MSQKALQKTFMMYGFVSVRFRAEVYKKKEGVNLRQVYNPKQVCANNLTGIINRQKKHARTGRVLLLTSPV